MKLTTETKKLKTALHQANTLSTRSASLPILANVLLQAQGDTLSIRSTNLQVGFESTFNASIEEDGVLSVDASLFLNTINTLASSEVTLSLLDNQLVVRGGNIESSLKTVPHEEFPTLPRVSGDLTLTLPMDAFINGVKSVAYAALISDIKPEIASIFITSDGEQLTFVATDSFRLAEKKIEIESLDAFAGLLLPIRNANEIVRILSDSASESVTFEVSENQVSIITDTIYITSRIIDGVFPDYQQIIPKDPVSNVSLLKSDIDDMLKVTNIFHDSLHTLHIDVQPDDSKVLLTSKNDELGSTKAVIEGSITGEALQLVINQRYLQEGLSVITSDMVSIAFHGAQKPLVVTAKKDPGFLYLIMPMQQ